MQTMLAKDIDYIICHDLHLIEKFRGKCILITGATGLVGHVLVRTFIEANSKLKLDVSIIALVRNKNKVDELYGDLSENSKVRFIFQDVREPFKDKIEKVDFIYHAAAVTDSLGLIEHPIEAFETQLIGFRNVLELAELQKAKVVYLSSMEIYGQPFVEGLSHEKDLGYVDPLVIRNGYPEAKRACEFLGNAYSSERGISVVSARLAQTFGPGVSVKDSRVFAQFIRSSLSGSPLVLHTDGSSQGNYCYLRDTIEALLLVMMEGVTGNAYNVVNEETNVSIKQLAMLIANEYGNGKVEIDIPKNSMGYAPKVNLHLSSDKLRKLGWKPTLGLKEMIARTIESFKEVEA
ncbi:MULTISPECIES: NAD(P)-dependent oxidoreductase [Lactobacillaceae]|uniref:NAD-dependent epimerase/dehydratase family protein n=1 Tax=Lactobacillaceae TaxID=33958 RepID=UPI0014565BCD|nr:NAD(P)-dependent oxidoreductase [Lactobacillus sp. HBUAS51381]NLR09051.1 NAD(P)-dependent oxidoreductase [Lactobacillus sp. HBUAS51381]